VTADAILELAQALPLTAAQALTLAVLEGSTLEAVERDVLRDLSEDDASPKRDEHQRDLDALAARGDGPGLLVLFEQVTLDLDEGYRPIARGVAERARTERTDDLAALAVLLSASTSWADVVSTAEALGANDRLGRLAKAAAGARFGDAAIAFLRAEAMRFIASLAEPTTDTAALALVVLVRRNDAAVLEAVATAARERAVFPASARALLELFGKDPSCDSARAAIATALASASIGP
jgi:hypothetical protein